MKRSGIFVATVLLSLIASHTWAGKYNKQLNIGDLAPTWKDLEGTDGKKHSLADFADKHVIVVCFTCNTCPYAVDYEDRLIALAKKFAADGNRCALVAINANKVKDDLAAGHAGAGQEPRDSTFPICTTRRSRSPGATARLTRRSLSC